ncbi:putative reticulon-like protein B12-like [Capsicum annuum]|nr:putative reticulon-like protein B12-like [Capsicum annuum]
MLEGIYVCAAPHCLKSFLKQTEFESHIHENHSDLLHQEKDANVSESASARKPAASESTVQAPPRPIFSPSSGSQGHDREDKAHSSQIRDQQPPRPVIQQKPPFTGSVQNHPLEQQSDSNPPPGFERPGMQNRLPQQGFDAQGSLRPDPGHFPDKQQGIIGSSPFPEYPMHMPQPHGFAVPMSSNPGLAPQFGYPQFSPDGAQPFYGAVSFEMPRADSTPDMGSEQGSLLGFPPGAAGSMNFPENYPRQWNMGQPVGQFEPTAVQPPADPQGRAVFFQGDYGRNAGVMSSNLPPPPSANRGWEGGQTSNSMDNRDSKGIVMPQPMTLPPPPPLPHHMSQLQRGGRHYGDTSHDGQGYGWQHEKRDSFGSSQD